MKPDELLVERISKRSWSSRRPTKSAGAWSRLCTRCISAYGGTTVAGPYEVRAVVQRCGEGEEEDEGSDDDEGRDDDEREVGGRGEDDVCCAGWQVGEVP